MHAGPAQLGFDPEARGSDLPAGFVVVEHAQAAMAEAMRPDLHASLHQVAALLPADRAGAPTVEPVRHDEEGGRDRAVRQHGKRVVIGAAFAIVESQADPPLPPCRTCQESERVAERGQVAQAAQAGKLAREGNLLPGRDVVVEQERDAVARRLSIREQAEAYQRLTRRLKVPQRAAQRAWSNSHRGVTTDSTSRAATSIRSAAPATVTCSARRRARQTHIGERALFGGQEAVQTSCTLSGRVGSNSHPVTPSSTSTSTAWL